MVMRANPCEVQGDAQISQRIADQFAVRMRNLGTNLISGSLDLAEFQELMQDSIRLAYIQQAIEGAVEQDERTLLSADLRRIERDIADQFEYLEGFVDDIEAASRSGKSLNFIPSRAALYAQSSKKSYWKQGAGVEIEHVPGDGSTPCLGHCTCQIKIECEFDSKGRRVAALVWWLLDPESEEVHCEICPQRAAEWAPLRIPLTQRSAA
jgi:hypothetical protein